MALITVNDLKDNVKELLDLTGTSLYDDKLDIYINGAIEKLTLEGVVNDFVIGSGAFDLYTVCVSYQVALSLDFAVQIERLLTLYITAVVTLRSE